MTKSIKCRENWRSPLKLTLLVSNSICFGGLLVLLVTGRTDGPIMFLTFSVGLMVIAGFAGAFNEARQAQSPSLDKEQKNKTTPIQRFELTQDNADL